MIRAILVVGWLGMLLLAAAAASGYSAHDAASAQQHLVASLFPCAALLFADLCLLVYLPGTVRLVRRTARELGLGAEWKREQARLARGPAWLAAAAVIVMVALFGTGFPVYTGQWPSWIHHLMFFAMALLQLALLL